VTELVHVTAVEVVGDHRLRLAFEDGAGGEIDLSNWNWRGVFEPLADPAYFRQVSLDEELGTIVWPNGADMAPETLHRWVVRGVKPTPV
jgi:PHD/YefM family antitoxin component YafN of YafNO toxin-antitoxin module